jgi:hypothetical protein
MQHMTRNVLLAAALALCLGSPAWSHHSHAMFDHATRVTVTGTVTEFVYRNPHGFLYIDVKQDNGETVSKWVEMSNLTNVHGRRSSRRWLSIVRGNIAARAPAWTHSD